MSCCTVVLCIVLLYSSISNIHLRLLLNKPPSPHNHHPDITHSLCLSDNNVLYTSVILHICMYMYYMISCHSQSFYLNGFIIKLFFMYECCGSLILKWPDNTRKQHSQVCPHIKGGARHLVM